MNILKGNKLNEARETHQLRFLISFFYFHSILRLSYRLLLAIFHMEAEKIKYFTLRIEIDVFNALIVNVHNNVDKILNSWFLISIKYKSVKQQMIDFITIESQNSQNCQKCFYFKKSFIFDESVRHKLVEKLSQRKMRS